MSSVSRLLFLCAVVTTVWCISYPAVHRDENVVDDYFGTKITDPYRWLENLNSIETKKFIEEQNKLSRSYLDAGPAQRDINLRFTELWNSTEYSSPVVSGGKYFYLKSTGIQDQPSVYVQDDINGQPRLFLDVNNVSGDIAIADFVLSEDGSTMAYALSEGGSDWVTIHFRGIKTGMDYPEILNNIRLTTMTWTDNYSGIFYSRYETKTGKPRDQKLYYHTLNTPQEDDILVAEFPHEPPRARMESVISHDRRYLILLVKLGPINNKVYYAPLDVGHNITGPLQFEAIVDNFDAEYQFITNDGSICLFLTNKDAPKYKLINIDLHDPREHNRTTLIPERDEILKSAKAADEGKLLLEYIKDVKSVLQLHDLKTGKLLHTFDLAMGSLEQIFAKSSESEIFISFISFLVPKTIYHVDLNKKPYKKTVFLEQIISCVDPSAYDAKQVFYSSHDGTKVPMFIVSKKNLPRNSANPTLLYGFGGFGVMQPPRYSVTRMVFLQHFNGIIAIANIRGGGEYGKIWHEAGSLLNKQTSFDDFQAAASYLITEKYTAPAYLAIQGGSGNGGLLVAACVNQRPELFAAALVQTGLLDMLRYHKFTTGLSWASEYGTSDNETEFRNLLKYSPLHNINMTNNRKYPAMLLLTADHDVRVSPLHTLKFIAAMQHEARGSTQRRLLTYIESDIDHGSGKPTAKTIAGHSDMLSFIAQSMGLEYKK